MNRLQKKCFIGSAGFHLLLVLILLVGPAFLTKDSKQELPEIDFVPSMLVDAAVAGGGSPRAQPPASAPQPEPPKPQPVQTKTPEPVVPEVKPQPKAPEPKQPDPEPVKPVIKKPTPEPVPEDKPRKPEISLRPIVRKPNQSRVQEQSREEKRAEEARKLALNRLRAAAQSVRSSTSSATVIDEDFGPGGGGPAYASYAAWVKKVYEEAWLPPDDTASDDAIVKATVTIARDGTVLNARISKPSGDSSVDRSVLRTLERVKDIGFPFPEGVKDKQRTYTIGFNLKAKRLLG